jgi:hypothetical protein
MKVLYGEVLYLIGVCPRGLTYSKYYRNLIFVQVIILNPLPVVGLNEINVMIKYWGVILKCSAPKFRYSVSRACRVTFLKRRRVHLFRLCVLHFLQW